MKKLPLADTGQEVSGLCMGALYYGTKTDQKTSFKLLDTFLERGGNFIDSANMYAHWIADKYTGGESETMLGRWLQERKNRDRVFLTSKVGIPYVGVEGGLKPHQIAEECEKSLKRLGTDRIDLYYAHTDDRDTPMEGYLEAFDMLVRQGKVRVIGASNFEAWRFSEALMLSQTRGWARFKAIQQRYSYLRPKPGWKNGRQLAITPELINCCAHHGITILAYSSQLYGYYANRGKQFEDGFRGADFDLRLKAIDVVAAIAVALAWLMQSDPPVIPVFASSNLAQLEQTLSSLDIRLSQDQMQRLNSAGGWDPVV